MNRVDVHAGVIARMVNDPNGPVARVLEAEGRRVVVQAKIHIGRGVSAHFHSTWRNPPPGPPMRREGDLQASLISTDAQIGPEGIEVLCRAPAVHRGYPYGERLIAREYKFVDLTRLS
jgi:hypothetical protein